MFGGGRRRKKKLRKEEKDGGRGKIGSKDIKEMNKGSITEEDKEEGTKEDK